MNNKSHEAQHRVRFAFPNRFIHNLHNVRFLKSNTLGYMAELHQLDFQISNKKRPKIMQF